MILWIILFLGGTALAFFGTFKISQELTKDDAKKQSHLIPDFLLFDCEVDAKFDDKFRDEILIFCKSKINVPDGTVEDLDTIPLSVFFDEKLYKESKPAKKNYKLKKDVYDDIRSFDILGMATSKDNSIIINLKKNSNKVIFLTHNTDIKESYIEVRKYDKKTNLFNLIFHNIQLDVNSKSMSQFITDLDKESIKISLITKPNIEIVEFKNIVLKTKSIKYFGLTNIEKDSLGMYNAKLNLLIK